MRAWLGPALVGLALFAALAVRAGVADHFQYLATPRPGADWARPGVLLPGQRAELGHGYDGQFYFYLAQDPFLTRPQTARSLDNTFRVRRLLYPLLTWALSLGRPAWVPYALVAINVAAGGALAALLARAAARAGQSPWWALLPLAYAGTWIPVLLDLTEPLQLALLVAGMTAGSWALLLGAALAKETAAVALATQAALAAGRREWGGAALHAAALAAYVAWALAVFAVVRGPQLNELGAHFLDPPGAPLLALARGTARTLVTLPVVLVCLAAIVRLARARDPAAWAAAAYAALVLGAGNDTWADPAAFYRVSAGVVVLLFLSWIRRRDRLGRGALYLGAATVAIALTLF